MMIRAASEFTPVATTELAIDVLQREGVINSAGYGGNTPPPARPATHEHPRLIEKIADDCAGSEYLWLENDSTLINLSLPPHRSASRVLRYAASC